jgi:hypothetical protein
VAFRTPLDQEGYKIMHSLVGAPVVNPIPVTDTNEFGEVNLMEMRLSGTLYPFACIRSSGHGMVYLDQPGELPYIVGHFLPLVYVERHLTITGAAAATPEPRAESSSARLKQNAKASLGGALLQAHRADPLLWTPIRLCPTMISISYEGSSWFVPKTVRHIEESGFMSVRRMS